MSAWSAGVRAQRNDVANRRLASNFANGFRRGMLNDKATDSGSGIKAFRREVFLPLPYFDHMHRFMAALVLREGYDVRFVDVNHRPRIAGQSKYTNFIAASSVSSDVFGVRWLQKRYRWPGWKPGDLNDRTCLGLVHQRSHLAFDRLARAGSVRLTLPGAVVQERDRRRSVIPWRSGISADRRRDHTGLCDPRPARTRFPSSRAKLAGSSSMRAIST